MSAIVGVACLTGLGVVTFFTMHIVMDRKIPLVKAVPIAILTALMTVHSSIFLAYYLPWIEKQIANFWAGQ